MQPISTNPTQTNALPAKTLENTLELRDIHLPEQIANYPTAYGWWILAALLLLITALTIIKFSKAAKRNQVKKQALAQLKNNADISNNELMSILKWAGMHYFSRVELAKLYGEPLQQFLLKQLSAKHQASFIKLSEQTFKNQYQPNACYEVNNNFQQAALLWLNQALPPKMVAPAKQKRTDSKLNQQSKRVSA